MIIIRLRRSPDLAEHYVTLPESQTKSSEPLLSQAQLQAKPIMIISATVPQRPAGRAAAWSCDGPARLPALLSDSERRSAPGARRADCPVLGSGEITERTSILRIILDSSHHFRIQNMTKT